MRLLRKLVCCFLPSLFLLWQWNSCKENCSRVNWSISAQIKWLTVSPASQLVKLPECKARHFFQQPITSSVTKECSVEQPIVRTFWNYLWLAEKCPSQSPFPAGRTRSQGEVQKSSVLSDHLNYNMLKGYYGIYYGMEVYRDAAGNCGRFPFLIN